MNAAQLDPLCCEQGVIDERRAPTLKRRLSAPPFMNPFSDARKRVRLSEPDDISTAALASCECYIMATFPPDASVDLLSPPTIPLLRCVTPQISHDN